MRTGRFKCNEEKKNAGKTREESIQEIKSKMLRSQRTDGPTYDQFLKNALEKEEVEPKALHSKQSPTNRISSRIIHYY